MWRFDRLGLALLGCLLNLLRAPLCNGSLTASLRAGLGSRVLGGGDRRVLAVALDDWHCGGAA